MNLEKILLDCPQWLQASGDSVILARRAGLYRNLEKYPFPPKASAMEKSLIFKEVSQTLSSSAPDYEAINLSHIGDMGKTLLFERDYIPLSLAKADGDRGVVFSSSNPNCLINDGNHIQIYVDCPRDNLYEGWEKINKTDSYLGDNLPYAFTEKKGFLLSNAKYSGTGLEIEFTLHLPALILTETITDVLSGMSQMGFLSEGKFRTGSDSWGALFSIRAGAYVADSEEEMLDKSSSIMLSLADRERAARKKIMKEAPRELEDKIFRSLGLLGSARILTIPQLLNLTSNIRLGADCGIVDISMEKLNTMILECMQSNIALNAPGKKPGKDELDVLRARRARDLTEQLHEGP
ncbi:MAG: hypothetical protein ACQEQ4_01090 [Fibrobacterota bacterium]